MKLLHVIPSVGPQWGGPARAVKEMARSLACQGVHVDIAATDDNGADRLDVPLGRPIAEDGYRTFYFARQSRFYAFSATLTGWLVGRMRDYDLVHVHALFSYPSVAAGMLARYFDVPYVVRPLGVLNRWGMCHRRPRLKRLSLRLIERPILADAAAIHYTSDDERREAMMAGVKDNAIVIPLGIDVSASAVPSAAEQFYRRYPGLRDRTVLLFLARLDAIKGLDLLLPAFARVRHAHPEAALVIAGSGDAALAARLRQEAERLGIAEDVVWPGFLTGDDKLAALAAADLFVMPSYSENFGIAAVEAMAAGLPVVITDGVGLAPAVQQAEAGLVVPCETGALACALARLVGDGDLRQHLGRNGERLARERYSAEAMGRNLLRLYHAMLRRSEEPLPLSLGVGSYAGAGPARERRV